MENENLATEVLHELKSSSKRWFVAFMITLMCWLATIGAFVWYISLPIEVNGIECNQNADNQSVNNFVKGDLNERDLNMQMKYY